MPWRGWAPRYSSLCSSGGTAKTGGCAPLTGVRESHGGALTAAREAPRTAAPAHLERPVHESGAVITRDPLPLVPAEQYRKAETSLHICVSAKRHGDPWTFSLSGNGIGIDTGHLKTIFEPFKRLRGRGTTFRFTLPAVRE